MMKRLYQILHIILWSFVGIFIESSIYKFYDYKTHPDRYVMQSAPWYLGIEIGAVFTAAVVVLLLIIMRIVKRKR